MSDKITVRSNALATLNNTSAEIYGGTSAWLDGAIKGERSLTGLSFFREGFPLENLTNYTVVGSAVIEVTVDPPDALVANEIAALQEALRQERLRTENAQAALKSRISKLSALTMEAA